MPTRANKAMRWALISVTTTFLLLVGAVFYAASRDVSLIRGDFCGYIANVHKVTLELPQVPARIEAEHNDDQLARKLGC